MYNSAYGAMMDYEATMAALVPMFTGILLAVLVIGILCLIATCKIFKKAGVPAWKALIPIYSSYLLFKIAGKPNLFYVSLISTLLVGLINTAPSLLTVLGLVQLVVHIMLCIALAKAFDKGGGFAAGLFFLYPIFLMILGMGSAQYVGAEGATTPDRAADAGVTAVLETQEESSVPVQEPRHLVGENGVFSGQRFALSGSMLIGTRPDDCDMVYPRGTPGVSGRHCTITYSNGVVTVTDENSTYGTWLDGQRLQPGVPATLHRGHQLALGSPKESFILHN